MSTLSLSQEEAERLRYLLKIYGHSSYNEDTDNLIARLRERLRVAFRLECGHFLPFGECARCGVTERDDVWLLSPLDLGPDILGRGSILKEKRP